MIESELVTIQGQCPSKSRNYRVGVIGGKNTKARGTLYKSSEFKNWEKDFLFQLSQFKNPMMFYEFEIGLIVYFKTYASDIDNSLKGILDCLQSAHWIQNDNQCMKINIEKRVSTNDPKILFKLKKWKQ